MDGRCQFGGKCTWTATGAVPRSGRLINNHSWPSQCRRRDAASRESARTDGPDVGKIWSGQTELKQALDRLGLFRLILRSRLASTRFACHLQDTRWEASHRVGPDQLGMRTETRVDAWMRGCAGCAGPELELDCAWESASACAPAPSELPSYLGTSSAYCLHFTLYLRVRPD